MNELSYLSSIHSKRDLKARSKMTKVFKYFVREHK